MAAFDAIVVGLGGIGSAAAWHIARRGGRVLGIDRFEPPHDRGSSHGQTRLIRLAYFEHPDYVPLLRRAFELWAELEAHRGRRLLATTGLLLAGPADGEVIAGTDRAARAHALPVERLSPAEAVRRWPAFRIPDDWRVIVESRAGALFVEDCVQAHLAAARAAGATLLPDTAMTACRTGDGEACVETTRGRFVAERIVLCPGAWAGGLVGLPGPLGIEFEVLRKSLFWLRPGSSGGMLPCLSPGGSTTARRDIGEGSLPCFGFDTPDGFFYGMPAFDERGVKVACHSGGRPLSDPLGLGRDVDPAEREAIDRWADAHLPVLGPSRGAALTGHAACLYTMSPDGHFVVGPHPVDERVILAAGFSGHGFKFAPVIGEALADLALTGRTPLSIGFLSPTRYRPSDRAIRSAS
jgi:sarcosine oxidase